MKILTAVCFVLDCQQATNAKQLYFDIHYKINFVSFLVVGSVFY